MSEVAWKAGALALAAALLVGAGAAGGSWLARERIAQAENELASCTAARGNLEALVKDQNGAIAGLANQTEQRQAKAAQAVADAQQQAGQHYASAQRLQQERTGGDPAAAAASIIDKELGL